VGVAALGTDEGGRVGLAAVEVERVTLPAEVP
jgi:hypothetical protein